MQKITMTLEDSLILMRWTLGVLVTFILIFTLFQGIANKKATDRNYALGKANNTYLRTVACISSVSPTKRTPDYVKFCYASAEEYTGVTVDHFGDGK